MYGKGAIPWMAGNPVAANLVLLFLVAGGLVSAYTIKQEVFPEFELDVVQITVLYPGASPSEVEEGILLAVEDGVQGIIGVKRVHSTALEGMASIFVELTLDADQTRVMNDIKNEIDRITSFPQDAERPIISEMLIRREVISMIIYGDMTEHTLKALADRVRDDLMNMPNITLVDIFGLRAPEISIEVPGEALRSYGLTLEQVAAQVAAESIDLPGGGVKTKSGEVLLRTVERRDLGREFENIDLVKSPDGSKLALGDIAKVIDGFEDEDIAAQFNGKPATMIKVFSTGDQTPTDIARTVKAYAAKQAGELPPGVGITTVNDWGQIFQDRFDLLLTNGLYGLALVLFVLGLLLEFRLAFWVTIGIPVSFLGSILFVPAYDVSINMISMFAFILTLGMVVDDAIVVGESIFEHRSKGKSFLEAAIAGTREVAMPVVFSVLTTVVAFMPLFFVAGASGKIFRVAPSVVVSVLTVSLIESIFILPSHLAHMGQGGKRGIGARLRQGQARISQLFEILVNKTYAPFLAVVLRWRYLTIAVGTGVLIICVGYVAGGRIGFSAMPRVDADLITATAELPFGVSIDQTKHVEKRLLADANAVIESFGGPKISLGIYSQVGVAIASDGMGGRPSPTDKGSHICTVQVFLAPSDIRGFTAESFARKWRKRSADIAGLESLGFHFEAVRTGGDKIDVQLSHPDMDKLKLAAVDLAARLERFEGVRDVNDGFTVGKPRIDFKLKAAARSLGLTSMDLARQVRSAFYGAEALRQQRGRDELRVMVRLPDAERRSEHDVERLVLRTRDGGEIPIGDAAEVSRSRSFTEITRTDGRRVVNVTADVDEAVTSSSKMQSTLLALVLPELVADYPGISYSLEGEARETNESMSSLLMALLTKWSLRTTD
jgi:multidrug efflux pump subunit AcrB